MADDDTIIEMMDSPEDVKVVVGSISRKVSALEYKSEDQQGQIDEINTFQKPLRWIFNKIAMGLGLAIAAGVLAWFGLE